MAVDYAKRGAPKKRKPAAKKNAPKRSPARKNSSRNAQPKIPFKALFITVIVVGVFVSFLWFLKSDRNAELAEGTAVTVPSLEPLPEFSAERWQYIEELENREVEVEVPEIAESRRRLMQCGSFRSFADAETLKARIAMAGFESQVRETHGSNGRWFRVILGPFENLRAAQRTNNQLQRTGVYGCQIWLWNLD